MKDKSVVPPLDYELGDYITGKDRSYDRSIYRAISITADRVLKGDSKGVQFETSVEFELISFMKRKRGGDEPRTFKNPIDVAREYRTATRQELIDEGVIPQSLDFITHECE